MAMVVNVIKYSLDDGSGEFAQSAGDLAGVTGQSFQTAFTLHSCFVRFDHIIDSSGQLSQRFRLTDRQKLIEIQFRWIPFDAVTETSFTEG